MKTLVCVLATLAMFQLSCKDGPPNTAGSGVTVTASGAILMELRRADVPSSVVSVRLMLWRAGYDTVKKQMNLTSDSSASLRLDSIAVGVWHLSVTAQDSLGITRYAGETDVIIAEGVVTHVYLTLLPVPTGLGGIEIIVDWGRPPHWTDYLFNPVLTRSGLAYDPRGVLQPSIFVDNGVYRIFFYNVGLTLKTSSLGTATSSDGINWTRPPDNPILAPGNSQDWDSAFVGNGPVIKILGTYMMYYHGFKDINGNWHIGLATSTDAVHWTKHGQPILRGTSGWEFQLGAGDVIKIDTLYYMYYTGRSLPNYQIGLAISSDGINWTRYASNPVLAPTEPWEGTGIYSASVIKDGAVYRMIYMNANGATNGFGEAFSNDGKKWTKMPGNPTFMKQMAKSEWAYSEISYPVLRKFGGQYRLYYSAYDSRVDRFAIGFAWR